MWVHFSAIPLRVQTPQLVTQLNFLTTSLPSSYLPLIICIAGELASLDIEEIIISMAPVAVIGKIAGKEPGFINRNSSRKTAETLEAKPRKLYKF